uniref:SCP domain-containing protein n=1 Tax=Anopheles atroparvus TaxID=41427 RepID=A0AAG5DWF2_ANOAO
MKNLFFGAIVFAHCMHWTLVKCTANDFEAWQTTIVDDEELQAAGTQALFAENTPTVSVFEATTTEPVWATDSPADTSKGTDGQERADANPYDIYCKPQLCLRYNRFGDLVAKKHVACGFNGSFADACPPGRMILRTDAELRKLILDLHNEVRDRLASGAEREAEFAPASRMPTLVWDDELANLAEINVRSCKFEHDECRSTARFLHAGQNLATGSYYLETDILEIVRNLTALWYNEYLDTTQEVLDKYTTEYNATIGHYTQMISDRTTAVGCGIVIYPK